MYDITAGIVVYNTKKEELKKAIGSFLNTDLKVKLWISDNSPTDSLEKELDTLLTECEKEYDIKNIKDKVEYIFNNHNGGYGWGHNKIMEKLMNLKNFPENNLFKNTNTEDDSLNDIKSASKSLELEKDNIYKNSSNPKNIERLSKYHLILNPDIYFEKGTLEKLFCYMENNKNTGQIMPAVKYPDGEKQYLCKLIPTPANLIFRRFLPFRKIKEKMDYDYEMKWSGYDKIMEVPILSGCFMFFRTENLISLKGFDERYFMYLEDYDLSRRMNEISETVFYPDAEIVHNHAKESYKSRKMTIIHMKSAIKYFNKWGWIFDKKRRRTNKLIKEKFMKSNNYKK